MALIVCKESEKLTLSIPDLSLDQKEHLERQGVRFTDEGGIWCAELVIGNVRIDFAYEEPNTYGEI